MPPTTLHNSCCLQNLSDILQDFTFYMQVL